MSKNRENGSALVRRRRGGFTLIELLVVVAIIGVLSSVVLASLNSARGKGNDAKIKAQLSSLRGSAEIYYANNTPNSYGVSSIGSGTGMCNAAANDPSGMDEYLLAGNYPAGVTLACYSTATNYKAYANLPFQGGYWCVDSLGASKYEAVVPAGDATPCL